MLDKYNFTSIEYISGKVEFNKELKNINLVFEVAHVYDWYDERIILNGQGFEKDGYLVFKINNGLETGLYEILSIKNEQGNILCGEGNNLNPIDAFSIKKCASNL